MEICQCGWASGKLKLDLKQAWEGTLVLGLASPHSVGIWTTVYFNLHLMSIGVKKTNLWELLKASWRVPHTVLGLCAPLWNLHVPTARVHGSGPGWALDTMWHLTPLHHLLLALYQEHRWILWGTAWETTATQPSCQKRKGKISWHSYTKKSTCWSLTLNRHSQSPELSTSWAWAAPGPAKCSTRFCRPLSGTGGGLLTFAWWHLGSCFGKCPWGAMAFLRVKCWHPD